MRRALLLAALPFLAGLPAQQKAPPTKLLWQVFAADDLPELQQRLRDTPTLRDSRDDNQQTLLHQAVDRNAVRCATWLLDGGAATDNTAYNGFTPLHLAASRGFVDCVKLLLKHKANLEVRSSLGQTALQMAAGDGQRAVVQLLHNAGAVYDLDTAVAIGDLPWVQRCLQDKDLVVDPLTVEAAARHGQTALLRLLLPRQGPPKRLPFGPQQRPPLTWFALPHAETLAFLLDQGFDPNAITDWQPGNPQPLLLTAADQNHAASIDVLLAHGVAVDVATPDGLTAVWHTARHGSAEALATLLAKGARIDDKGPNLATLTTGGMQRGAPAKEREQRRRTAEILLGHGVPLEFDAAMALGRLADVDRMLRENPTLATSDGDHPVLCRAAMFPDSDLLQHLLAAGAKVASADVEGCTPLHWCAFWGSLPGVELLLAHGAPVSPAAKNGRTPLHEAVRSHQPEVAERLLRAKADRDARDQEGKRPIEHASTELRATFERLFAAR